jgi:hypothetical protein
MSFQAIGKGNAIRLESIVGGDPSLRSGGDKKGARGNKKGSISSKGRNPPLVNKVLQFPRFKTPIFYTDLPKEFFKL